jgi:hypothetical protein
MRQEIVADVRVEGLKALESLTAELEDVGKSGAAASKKLNRIRAAINKTGSESKKAAPDLEDMASKFRAMGSSGTLAGDSLERLSVVMGSKLGMVIGGVTLGLAAIGGAVKLASASFTALSEAIGRTIERKRELADWDREARAVVDTADRLAKSQSELGQTWDEFAFAATGGQRAIEALAIATERLTQVAELNFAVLQTGVGSAVRGASTLVLLADSVDEVAAAMSAAVDPTKSLEHQSRALWTGLSMVLQVAGNTAPIYDMVKVFNDLGASAWSAADGIAAAAAELAAGFTGRVKGFLGAVAAPFVAATRKKRRSGGGRRAPKPIDPELDAVLGPSRAMLALDKARTSATQRRVQAIEEETSAAALAAFAAEKNQERILEIQRRVNDERRKAILLARAIAAQWDEVTTDTLARMKDGFIGVGEAVAYAMGEFAAGTSTISKLGDAILDLFSNLAGNIGSFFIQSGIGMMFLSPAQGAGLIAAGIAMQALAGFLGGKGSGNRGSGGGGGSKGAASSITREVQRSLRGPDDRGPMNQTIEVVIAGRSIEPEMVNVINDITRLNRSRQLARLRRGWL